MPHQAERPKRKSIRAPLYDYSQPGAYFVTICVKNWHPRLGSIHNGVVELSPTGRVVDATWIDLECRFPFVSLDVYVVMPNHFHGILEIVSPFEVPPEVRTDDCADCEKRAVGVPGVMNHAPTRRRERHTGHAPVALGEIIRTFKAVSARRIRVEHDPTFTWQRNYYEHIIRSERSLDRLRDYIDANPALWEQDSLHVQRN